MTQPGKTDYLIIGQGLAGTLLAHFLLQQNKTVILLDEYRPYTSSRVAAGLFHPITGRRLVKSWMVETLFEYSKEFYAAQEKLLQRSFFYTKELIEIISSPHEFNIWSERLDDPGISQYLGLAPEPGLYKNKLQNAYKTIALSGSGWMDIALYLELSLQYFLKLKIIESGKFVMQKLEMKPDGIHYGDIHAEKIVFCEGSDALKNPLWNWIPFLPSKGEILTIASDDLPENYILLHGIFIIPIGNHRFRVGSTYSWNYEDELPSEEGKIEILDKLQKIISVPFEILDHKSAIRPTVKDRRPLLGKHPIRNNVFLFNGLGTKGVLLGPYFAKIFSEYLVQGKPLHDEVDLQRFQELFAQSQKPAQ